MSTPTRVLILVSLALLSGCTAISDLTVTRPFERPLSEFRSTVLEVTTSVEGVGPARARFETLAVVALREAHVFGQVLRSSRARGEPVDMTLRLNIVQLSGPGDWAQTIFGLFAPRSRVVVEAECIDAATDLVVGAFRAEGASAMGYVYSGGFEQAAEACLERVVRCVRFAK